MNLYFINHNSNSDSNYLAFYKHWNYNKNNGNYNTGDNFLSIHWELKNNDTSILRLHVESANNSKNPILSQLKKKIINQLQLELLKSNKIDFINNNIGTFKFGRYINTPEKYKSTEVFRIILSNPSDNKEKNIITINDIFKDLIDNVIHLFKSDINNLKLKETLSF